MASLFKRLTKQSFKATNQIVKSQFDFIHKRNLVTIGESAPSFSCKAVVNNDFETLNLSDYKGRWVVLFFYPLDFTFVCPTEIIEFNDKASKFSEIGCDVIGASIDSHFSHLAWIQTPRSKGGLGDMTIPLLSDIDKSLSTNYGCLLKDGFTVRATYIIDNNGIVRSIELVDRPIGRNVDEVLRRVQALQFADEYGEVCPAQWQPGDKTMKPDPVGKLEYFEGK